MWLDSIRHGGVEYIDGPALNDQKFPEGFVVVALKATFSFVQDYDPVPEFGLTCLLVSDTGRVAFICMSDPLRLWIQVVVGSSLHGVASRMVEKIGDQVWHLDEFGQL